jgi:predicted transposase/invertase (TIGR01784 family)
MNIFEWNWEDAIAVAQKEARQEGREAERLETARNALSEGLSLSTVQKITGLDLETIKKLQAKLKK